MGFCDDYKDTSKFLNDALKAEVAKGVGCYNSYEAGLITDQIKDMEEAIKYHYEALYYKLVSMAMLGIESEDMLEMKDIMGYNHRHLNNGEFASAGRGHIVSGYNPTMKEQQFTGAYLRNPEHFRHEMMSKYGYNDENWDDGVSKAYKDYQNAMRHYHETGDPSSKKRMEEQFLKSLEEIGEVGLDMFEDADPTMQRKMREAFGKLYDKTKV